MKRRKIASKSRFTLNDIAFDLVSSDRHKMQITSIYGRVHYKIVFSPPIDPVNETSLYLRLTHLPSKRSDVCIALMPEVFVQHDDCTRVYETHTLVFDDEQQITKMYIAIDNTNLNGNDDATKIYMPVFDFGIKYFDQKQYQRLDYVFPDQIHSVDASIIPQHNPLYTKKKGAITSSSVPRYLGYFIPDPNSDHHWDRKKAEKWTLSTKEDFSGWKGVNVRFGSVKECEAMSIYIGHYNKRTFYQTGYTVHPTNPGEWGASPDGLVVDENGEKRTVEIKSSRSDKGRHFSGYHIPQVVWEMACLGVQKGDLVKYCCPSNNNQNQQQPPSCRVATIDRDLDREKKIEKMVAATKAAERMGNTKKFKELVFSKEYRDMRAELDQEAASLAYTDIKVPVEKIKEMLQYRQKKCQVQLPSGDPLMDAIEHRQMELCMAYNEDRLEDARKMALQQIRDYADLFAE